MPADIQRTVLVASREPRLWAALRDRLDPQYTLVRYVTPEELPAVWPTLLPWPWMVVGDCDDLPGPTLALLNAAPVAVLWLGPSPRGLRATPAADWRNIYESLRQLFTAGVGDLQLAPVRGVATPAGRLDHVEVLENLLAAWPSPLPAQAVSTERTTRLNRLLAANDLAWKVIRRRGYLYLKNHEPKEVSKN